MTQDELAAELSGVLCRCTGYRNILSAVAEVARTHPDGLPAPLNCPGRRAARPEHDLTGPALDTPARD